MEPNEFERGFKEGLEAREDRPRFDGDQLQDIIFDWMDMVAKVRPELQDSKDKWKLAARKSNYLHRRLMIGQKKRLVECPKHKGKWSGYAFPGRCECSLGSYDITGWLPEEGDETERLGQCMAVGCPNEATQEWVVEPGVTLLYCPFHK